MLGWLCWSEGQERAGRAELAGLPVLRVPVRRKNGTPEWLLRRCRTVSLDAPDPEGAYARALRRSLGAVLRTGDAGAEVRLLFVRRGPERAGDIPLYPGAEGPKAALRLPEAWEARMPKGAQREGVIAALLAAGRLQREEIAIDSA